MDLAPDCQIIETPRGTLKVYGITMQAVFSLIRRFPVLQKLFTREGLTKDAILEEAPNSIAAIIAAACGYPDDPAAEQVAAHQPVDIQIAILSAASKLTFSEGFGPFVNRVKALGNLFGGPVGNGLDTSLEQPSSPLRQADIPPKPLDG